MGSEGDADKAADAGGLRPVRLRATGHDEYWLQDRLAQEPQLLGLGEVEILGQEVSLGGGNLDILAAVENTYFAVEVQLDAVNASYGFRVSSTGRATGCATPTRPM